MTTIQSYFRKYRLSSDYFNLYTSSAEKPLINNNSLLIACIALRICRIGPTVIWSSCACGVSGPMQRPLHKLGGQSDFRSVAAGATHRSALFVRCMSKRVRTADYGRPRRDIAYISYVCSAVTSAWCDVLRVRMCASVRILSCYF